LRNLRHHCRPGTDHQDRFGYNNQYSSDTCPIVRRRVRHTFSRVGRQLRLRNSHQCPKSNPPAADTGPETTRQVRYHRFQGPLLWFRNSNFQAGSSQYHNALTCLHSCSIVVGAALSLTSEKHRLSAFRETDASQKKIGVLFRTVFPRGRERGRAELDRTDQPL
jgi:hypothetical protein